MHKNQNYNIVQHGCGFNKTFVVILGQRLPSGAPAKDAKIVSEPMSRDEAIKLADRLESSIAA